MIIINATKAVIIYRVLTRIRHGIKHFIAILGKVRRYEHWSGVQTLEIPDPRRIPALPRLPNDPAQLTFLYFSFPISKVGIITRLISQGCYEDQKN